MMDDESESDDGDQSSQQADYFEPYFMSNRVYYTLINHKLPCFQYLIPFFKQNN